MATMTPKDLALAVSTLIRDAGYQITGVEFRATADGRTSTYRFDPDDGQGGTMVSISSNFTVSDTGKIVKNVSSTKIEITT